ncbi:ABC transporter substrate-binding protein [Plantactinospora sp. WMMB782]|uniref:ABC transporter substrate-binding protein n=1 Tax=Plantactinospora sp. WMMB782 TaxID=3404121 RepID=UPI003B92A431
MRRHTIAGVLSLSLAATLTACGDQAGPTTAATGDAAAPKTLTNCGQQYTYRQAPQRIVTSSTPATEMILALGQRNRLVGTVAPGELLPEYAGEMQGVQIIAEKAFPPPSKETVLAARPELVVSAYPDDYGPKALGDRAKLAEEGVNSYLLSGACTGHKATVDDTYTDLKNLGDLLGAPEKADELVTKLRGEIDAVKPVAGNPTVFVYSGGKEKPTTPGAQSLVDDLLRRAGASNAFPETTGFGQVNWEELVKRDPDAILIEDQAFEPADAAIAFLSGYPPIQGVTAVKEKRFIVVPVNDNQPGLRSGRALRTIVAGLG